MNNEQKHELLMKPAVVGLAGAALTPLLIPMDYKIYGLPAPVVMGLTMGVASWRSAMSNEFVYESVMSENESELVYGLTAPTITGLATVGVVYSMTGSNMSMKAAMQFFALGAGAEIGGQYMHDSVLGPAIDM